MLLQRSTYCFPQDEYFLRSEKKLFIRKAPKNFEQADDSDIVASGLFNAAQLAFLVDNP